MTQHRFGIEDYVAAFKEANAVRSIESGFKRLCSGTPHHGDPGFLHLSENAPSLGEIRDFFRREIQAWKDYHTDKRLREGMS